MGPKTKCSVFSFLDSKLSFKDDIKLNVSFKKEKISDIFDPNKTNRFRLSVQDRELIKFFENLTPKVFQFFIFISLYHNDNSENEIALRIIYNIFCDLKIVNYNQQNNQNLSYRNNNINLQFENYVCDHRNKKRINEVDEVIMQYSNSTPTINQISSLMKIFKEKLKGKFNYLFEEKKIFLNIDGELDSETRSAMYACLCRLVEIYRNLTNK